MGNQECCEPVAIDPKQTVHHWPLAAPSTSQTSTLLLSKKSSFLKQKGREKSVGSKFLQSKIKQTYSKYSARSVNSKASLRSIVKIQSAMRMFLVRRKYRREALLSYNRNVELRLKKSWQKLIKGVQLPRLSFKYSQGQGFVENAEVGCGFRYTGQILGGQKHGRGILVSSENYLLVSNWQLNKCKGQGKLITANNQVMQGNFQAGLLQGPGFWQFPGGFYQGVFRKGVPHGAGKLQQHDLYYEGEFNNGAKQGPGFIKTKQSEYRGLFMNDKFEGYGELISADWKYRGEFANGLYHGVGHYVTKGKQFVGQFEAGGRSGFGVILLEGGCCVKGEFGEDGRLNGVACVTEGGEDRYCQFEGGRRSKWFMFAPENRLHEWEELLFKRMKELDKLIG